MKNMNVQSTTNAKSMRGLARASRRGSVGTLALALAGVGLVGCVASSGGDAIGTTGSAVVGSSPLRGGTVIGGAGGDAPRIGVHFPPRPRVSPLEQIRNHAKQFIHALPLNASPSSKEVPYQYGLSYGLGIDSPSGTAMNLIATGTPSTIPGADGQNMTFRWDEVTSTEDMMSHLGISADASASIGLFSASARFNFAKDVHFNSNSVFAVLDIEVMNAFSQIDQPAVSPNAANLASSGNMQQFQSQFGDRFVRGILTGGKFFGTVEIETTSETDKTNIESTLSGAFSVIGSANVSLSSSFQKAISDHSVHVMVYTEGGTPPVPIPTDPVSLMNAANAWLPSVKDHGAAYTVLVDGDSILPLPNPPTYVDLQNQEDVLTQCSLFRNADMQTLNDIEFVMQHPDQFVERADGTSKLTSQDMAALTAIQNQIAQDMTTITKAADTALADPKSAAIPTLHIAPPAVLPVIRIADTPTVTVPNVVGMYAEDADQLIKSLGLVSYGSVIVNDVCSEGDIYTQSPPPGVSVEVGSTVYITDCRNPTQE